MSYFEPLAFSTNYYNFHDIHARRPDHAPRSGLLRALHAPREHELHRARLAHGVCEALRPAAARDRVDVHLWLPELGVGHGEGYARHQREFAPASDLRK